MKREYDLSKMKSRPNRFAKRLTRQVTIRMGIPIINYFKELSGQTGIPYQTLINLYLTDCMGSGRKLSIRWPRRSPAVETLRRRP
jgi:predicted DNA binding CopG/RHH family protein